MYVSPHLQRAAGASIGLIRHQSGSSTGILSSDPTVGRGSPLSDGNDDDDDTIYESSPPSSEAFWSPFGPDASEEEAGEFCPFVPLAGNLLVLTVVGGRAEAGLVCFVPCSLSSVRSCAFP